MKPLGCKSILIHMYYLRECILVKIDAHVHVLFLNNACVVLNVLVLFRLV